MMKRVIKATKRRIESAEDITDRYFSDFEGRAYNIGYDFKVDSDMNIEMSARKDADMMPKIEIAKEEMSDGTYLFSPTMIFPVLNSDDLESSDSLEYWTERWNRVARFLTSLINYNFNLANFEEKEQPSMTL